MNHTGRIVVLVDMDCFYCQVEENLNTELKGKPVAVVQYNEWRGGGIIAVNYEARAKGVTRHMRGNDAKEVCPDINLVKVPQIRGKADLNKYRDAGKHVADVLQTFTPLLERASVDEAYLDITEAVEKRIQKHNFEISINQLQNTFVVGSETLEFIDSLKEIGSDDSNFRLAVGGVIAEEMRAEVYKITGYRCSAGVAHNKILAKLVCGLHKPNKQTLLPQNAVALLYQDLPVKKIKGFGGKFGEEISQTLNIKNMGELGQFSQKELSRHFDEKAVIWLYNIARGIDHDPVTVRLISKSIGCSKNFLGKNALVSQDSVEHWLQELLSEVAERSEKDLQENNRRARTMTINFSHSVGRENISASRTLQITSYDQPKLVEKAMEILNKNCRKSDETYKITHLGFSLGNFEDTKSVRSIASFFKNMESSKRDKEKFKQSDNNSIINQNINCTITSKEPTFSQTKVEKLSNNLSASDQAKLLESSTFLESDSDSSDDDNSSIFSRSTVSDTKIDEENLVYLENVRPDSVLDQHFPHYENKNESKANLSSSSVDSISQEISQTEETGEKYRPPSDSFFAKYFDDEEVDRDFNTSKMMVDSSEPEGSSNEGQDFVDDNMEIEISVKSQEKLSITNDSPQKKYWNNNSPILNNADKVSNTEMCLECGKCISVEEIMSHMDYHFALKIVRSEAHLYKTPININTPKSPTVNNIKENKPNVKKTRRKSNEILESIAPISKFFKKDENLGEVSLENSQLCEECNKRIKLENFTSHLDYHAAKNLHLELNSQVSKLKSPAKVKKSDKKLKSTKTAVNIKSFFTKS